MRYEDDFGSFWMVDDSEFVKRRHLSRGRPRKYEPSSSPNSNSQMSDSAAIIEKSSTTNGSRAIGGTIGSQQLLNRQQQKQKQRISHNLSCNQASHHGRGVGANCYSFGKIGNGTSNANSGDGGDRGCHSHDLRTDFDAGTPVVTVAIDMVRANDDKSSNNKNNNTSDNK